MIESKRLRLIPCNYELLELTIKNRRLLKKIAGVEIPDSWPVCFEAYPFFLNMIDNEPAQHGWLNYFVIHKQDKVMSGDAGFLGRPDENGVVEIRYCIIPEYRNMGIAKECVNLLSEWAFSTRLVKEIVAYTLPNNDPSINVLRASGFSLIRTDIPSEEGGKYLWQLKIADYKAMEAERVTEEAELV